MERWRGKPSGATMRAAKHVGHNEEARVNCPNCGSSVTEGVERCPACDVELTWVEDDADPAHGTDALVTVLETSDLTLVPVVQSLLEAEGIPCIVENELLQSMIGIGHVGANSNLIVGPMRVNVALEHAEAARELVGHHFRDLTNEAVN